MLIKKYTLTFKDLVDNGRHFIHIKDDRGDVFALVHIFDSKATFTLIDFDTEIYKTKLGSDLVNPFRVPLTSSVHVFLREYFQDGSIDENGDEDELDICYASIPFVSKRERKQLVFIPNVGLWDHFKYKLAICFTQNCNVYNFLSKMKIIQPYKGQGHKKYFLETFVTLRNTFFMKYREDRNVITHKSNDVWNMRIEKSKTGDCEDFSGFIMHVFHTLKYFWKFIHYTLLGVTDVPSNICDLYEGYLLLCNINGGFHCKFALKDLEKPEMLTFECTALNYESCNEYENFVLVNSLDFIKAPKHKAMLIKYQNLI